METFEHLRGRPVTVMGLGLFGGGVAVARHLARLGARVTVTDLRSERELAPSLRELEGLVSSYALGGHRPEDFCTADLVVANPAVKRDSPFLALARDAGVPVTSEVALFLDCCPARVAAITGTQGKSSTAHALAQLLQAGGVHAWLGGNIGRPLLEVAGQMRAQDVVVLELSSYQLETLPDELRQGQARVEVAAIVNVLADHIERHGSFEAYARAKLRILELVRPGGAAFVERALLRRHAAAAAPQRRPPDLALHELGGAERAAGSLPPRVLDAARARRWRASFQRENALLAARMAQLLGVGEERLAPAMEGLEGLPHRLEPLGPRGGHPVFDNGVSTTPDSTVSALLALDPGCTLVCGGQPKALPVEELVSVAAERARRVLVFGAAVERWLPLFAAAGVEAHSAPGAEEAARRAFELMGPGEALLFSPACASFDAWPNFRERALAFRRALPPMDPDGQGSGARL